VSATIDESVLCTRCSYAVRAYTVGRRVGKAFGKLRVHGRSGAPSSRELAVESLKASMITRFMI